MELEELLPLCVASVGAPAPPAACLLELHAVAASGALRDAEPATVAALAPCFALLLRAAAEPSTPPHSARLLLEIFVAAADGAEWGAAVRLAVGAAPPALFGALCARLAACAQRAWDDAQRGIFGTTLSVARAADAVQPKGGVLGGFAVAPEPAPAPALAPAAPARRGPTRAPFEELRALRGLLAWLWLHFPQHRGFVERGTERLLRGAGREVAPEAGAAVGAALQLAGAVCAGAEGGGGGSGGGGGLFSARSVSEAARLLDLLAPLLSVSGGAGGVGSVLASYFEPLSALLLGVAAAHGGALLPAAVEAVASALTAALAESAARAELLLTLLRSLAGAGVAAWAAARAAAGVAGGGAPPPPPPPPPPLPPSFLQRLVLPLVADNNSRLAQAALAFFSDASICEWCAVGDGEGRAALLASVRALLRDGQCGLHWNPTVNRHTHAALCALRAAARDAGCEGRFLEAAEALCAGGGGGAAAAAPAASAAARGGGIAIVPPRVRAALPLGAGGGVARGAAGRRVDDEGSSSSGSLSDSSLSDAEKAPWRNGGGGGGGGGGSRPPTIGVGFGGGWHPSSGAPPPLTITGVAPWAASGAAGRGPPQAALSRAGVGSGWPDSGAAARAARRAQRAAELKAEAGALAAAAPAAAAFAAGATPFEAHLSSLLPPAPAPPRPLAPGVARLPPPLQPEPVQVPTLAFHDLVFGAELGRGSFSTVRAARHIQRGPGAPPSAQWPWYAVKELSAATLRSAAYRPAARREAAVLGALRHPATTRLASAFQWRGGVYLVLEHAGGGDLHELLAGCGPLSEDAARFLMGEVAAALMHVHDLGFAFGDCKPENVVLVAPPADGSGGEAWADAGGLHAKLADFAACRPVSAAGAAVLAAGRGVLRTLRSGDWRDGAGGGAPAAAAAASPGGASGGGEGGSEEAEGEEGEDDRIEGTPEYLAPELQGGASLPTVASDAYAFGVTLFQALTGGRMPDADALWPPAGGAGGVRWAGAGAEGAAGGGGAAAPPRGFPPGFPAAAVPLVRALLHPDAAQRMGGGPRGFQEIVDHPWFAALGRPVAQLYLAKGPAHPQTEGGGKQRVNPQWARRHASMMWAPSLQAARALRVTGGEGGARAAAGARAAGQLLLGELMALAALPPLCGSEGV